MQIIANIQDGVKSVYVEGSVFQSQEEEWLLQELEYDMRYIITLIGVRYISSSIVSRLYDISSRCELYVTDKHLWLYLKKLSINCKLKSSQPISSACNVIAIGGSAGSFQQLIHIISNLPLLDVSIFVILHISDGKNYIAQILQTYTKYKVIDVKDNMPIELNTIYIASSSHHLTVANNHIHTPIFQKINYARPSISVAFKSLSNHYKQSLIAVLLSGYGSDGVDVLSVLQQNSSTILLANPDECEAKDMVQNSINSHNYTKILPINEIVEHIKANSIPQDFDDDSLNSLFENIYNKYGYDFRNYDKKSLQRRVQVSMKKENIKTLSYFEKEILSNEEIFYKLFCDLSINVTMFFRNPEVYNVIKESILPYLDTFSFIKIWSAGCASGEEPYSLAILLHDMGILHKSLIYATDFNNAILQEAKNGIFAKANLRQYIHNYKALTNKDNFLDYFDETNDNIVIKDFIKEKIVFFNHNLATDGVMNEFQLILCRNTLIYFDNELKQRVIKLFDTSLERGGYLVLGETENINPTIFVTLADYDKKHKIYKKTLFI